MVDRAASRLLNTLILFVSLVSCSITATAENFYLDFHKCSVTVSYPVLSDQNLKTFEGDPFFMSCIRNSQKIRCEIDFFGDKRTSDEYRIDIEAPPLLIFTNPGMTEHYVVDMSQHGAALVSRVIRPKFAAAKTCHGTYVTEFEKKANPKTK